MSFTNITDEELEGKGVTGLPDTPGLSTIEMQQKFDEYSVFLKDKLKTLITELEAEAGALNIGATVPENITADGNIQSILNGLRQYVDDTVIALGTGDMATGIYDPNRDGVIAPAQGGTGQTTMQAARNAMGLGNTLNALPIANGGTGASTVAEARNNLGLGNTEGALPVTCGGTGKNGVTAGRVLVGNGANTMEERAIDSTSGGTQGSDSLITSGAVKAGISAEATTRGNAITQLRQDFTDGCNAIANALIAQGVTPVKAGTNYTPTELIDSIMELFYNGRLEAPAPNIDVKIDGKLLMYKNTQRMLSTVDPLRSVQIIDIDGYTTTHNVNTHISSDSDSGYPDEWEHNYTYHYPGARNTPVFPSKQEGEAALQLIGRGLSVLGTSITKSVSGNYYSIQDIVDAISEIKDCGKQYPLAKDYSFYLVVSCYQALLPRAQLWIDAYKNQTKRERWDTDNRQTDSEINIDGIFATLTIPPVS